MTPHASTSRKASAPRGVFLLCLLLAGCQQPSILTGSGVRTEPPTGYTVGCQNNPDAVACKETRK